MITTSKTHTPELTPEVLDRLWDYADHRLNLEIQILTEP
jgi:hypothetical protein